MIKLKENFDVEFHDLLDMDLKFAYILDLFNVKDIDALIKQREEILETYLLDCKDSKEFEEKKKSVKRYFDNTSFNESIAKILESEFEEE